MNCHISGSFHLVLHKYLIKSLSILWHPYILKKYSLFYINFLNIIVDYFCEACEVIWILVFVIVEAKMELGHVDGFWEEW